MKYEHAVLDGSRITELIDDAASFTALCDEMFSALDVDADGSLSKGELRPAILGLGIEMGVPPPETVEEADVLVEAAFKSIDQDKSGTVDRQEFEAVVKETLSDIAAVLRKTPVAVEYTEFDGELLQALLDDNEAFDGMAEKMFADLDADGSGALSKAEMRPMITELGEDLGLPPSNKAETEALYDKIFDETDADKSGEVDPAEFKTLVKTVLQEIASELKADPIKVTQLSTAEVSVFDGTGVRALLEDKGGEFTAFCNTKFIELDLDDSGDLSLSELRPTLEQLSSESGMPPASDQKTQALLEDLFKEMDLNKDGKVSKDEFKAAMSEVLTGMAEGLEEAPIVVLAGASVTTVE